jgi:hypothetical protein
MQEISRNMAKVLKIGRKEIVSALTRQRGVAVPV